MMSMTAGPARIERGGSLVSGLLLAQPVYGGVEDIINRAVIAERKIGGLEPHEARAVILGADPALERMRMARYPHEVVRRPELAAEARRQARDVADAAPAVVDAVSAHMRVADELELVVLAAAQHARHAGMVDLVAHPRVRPA